MSSGFGIVATGRLPLGRFIGYSGHNRLRHDTPALIARKSNRGLHVHPTSHVSEGFGGASAIPVIHGNRVRADVTSLRGSLVDAEPGESLITYVERVAGSFDLGMYKRLLGAANPFKEGDAIVGVAAREEHDRQLARTLLSNTKIGDIDAQPLIDDTLGELLKQTTRTSAATSGMSVGHLKGFLLGRSEEEIQALMPSLSSMAIGCVVKLMSNEELVSLGAKIFNPLPGTHIGAKGYLGGADSAQLSHGQP